MVEGGGCFLEIGNDVRCDGFDLFATEVVGAVELDATHAVAEHERSLTFFKRPAGLLYPHASVEKRSSRGESRPTKSVGRPSRYASAVCEPVRPFTRLQTAGDLADGMRCAIRCIMP